MIWEDFNIVMTNISLQKINYFLSIKNMLPIIFEYLILGMILSIKNMLPITFEYLILGKINLYLPIGAGY